MSYRICTYDEDNPQLVIVLKNGRRIEFSVAGFKPDAHDWLGGMLERMFEEEIEYAVARAIDVQQQKMRHLMGIR